MKKVVAIFSFLTLLMTTTVNAGETSVKVDIKQEGSGTSSVKVNGEEWKLEGPGEIHVDKKTSLSPSPNPVSSSIPTSTPAPTATPSPKVEQSAIDQILVKLEEVKEAITNFLSQIF